MLRILQVATVGVVLSTMAYAESNPMLKPGDTVKAIEADRAVDQRQAPQSGRSATDPQAQKEGAPLGGQQKEENVLKGVDPAVK
jgi:hypothetical protein